MHATLPVLPQAHMLIKPALVSATELVVPKSLLFKDILGYVISKLIQEGIVHSEGL